MLQINKKKCFLTYNFLRLHRQNNGSEIKMIVFDLIFWPIFLCHRETIVEEDEQPSGLLFGREGWNRRTFPLPTSTPLGGLPTIAQSPYGSMSSLRQSQDSLRASQEQLRASQEGSKCWDFWDFTFFKNCILRPCSFVLTSSLL